MSSSKNMVSKSTFLKENYFRDLYKEWDKITKNKNNISQSKNNCPVCNSGKILNIFKKKKLTFCICSECTHVFINPYFKDKIIDNHFKNAKSWSVWSKKILLSRTQQVIEKKKYSLGLKLIKNNSKIKNVLDVGCSSGHFLRICNKIGLNAEGIEPSKQSADFGKKKYSLKIFNTTLSKFTSIKKYDLITCWASLEYSNNLKSDIKKIYKFLNPKGKLLIYTSGNSNSFIMRILRESCIGFVFNRRNYFNPKSLNYLLDKNGFIFKKNCSDSNDITIVNNFINYGQPYKVLGNKNFSIEKYLPKNFINKEVMGYKFLSLYEKK